MVKDTGKQIAKEAWEREAISQQAQSKLRAQIKLPTPLRWLERWSWVVPVVQEKAAPLTETIKARLPKRFFQKEQNPADVVPESIPTAITLQPPVYLGVDPIYRKYHCVYGNTLGCEWTQKTLEQDPTATNCLKCGFPTILPPRIEVRGYRGRYRVDSFLGQRGMGRLYRGIQVADQQPVVIKEYLLPNPFSLEETRSRKQVFESVAGLTLADGRIQDIRLNSPWDAIADPVKECCYLVTNGHQDGYPTLRAYLTSNGPMTEAEVRRVLNQVLQTLEFLHTQKFSLPSGQIKQKIAHGNISLDSLLIMADTTEFFIHVSDLALWERLFDLPTARIAIPIISQDLVDLGYVAFYLLAGGTVDPVSNQPLNPKYEQHWKPVEPALKTFIRRLLELETPFANSEEARQALLQLPPPPPNDMLVITGEIEEDKTKLRRPPLLLLGTLGLVLLGALIWFLIQKSQKQETSSDDVVICCLKDVSAVPPGRYTYTGETGGIWSYIQRQRNLTFQNQTLEETLEKSQPKLQLNYQPDDSLAKAISEVESGKIDFAVTNLVNQLTPQLRYKEVAYDGLVVFVAFSYSKRERSLPNALNGKISFEQLRDLYTGKITNWSQIKGANLPNLPVKLYIPPEQEALQIFEQRVLKQESAIAAFKNLQTQNQQQNTLITSSTGAITTLPTLNMLQQVLEDFEKDDIGSIGFATFSQVFGQCSAYPLAVVDGNKAEVQTLVNDKGNSIDPNTDLCGEKGSYKPNIQVFRTGSYPLGYPIIVLYPGDNSRPPIGQKFADMLRTAEVQRLLEKAGLVPLQKTQK
ncbi:ABC-type phosphate transport system, periplasmic component [Cylindrospermum stagnale PCC 7417]|uniref:ABC-type phosphate transport system, periplasmic component n=1 Tax=Cylindrospermum stagnale PCC 7417 TaxID=56107 RepID=K9WWL3_9NOST|nr:substrate-binding domain-containing protein [Cylindrospermum stagnale]AFZ24176.1 ABC-type phosphate transport system, periplasmic component [Cylindrospermum stagnale PCC 7417]